MSDPTDRAVPTRSSGPGPSGPGPFGPGGSATGGDRSRDPGRRLSDEQRTYLRFGAMVLTSTAVMFVLMYLNTYRWDHVRWSETRFFMAFVMGASMAVIMLGYMLSMYRNRRVNVAILAVSVLVFAGALFLVRSQTTVQDRSYMRAMIPHHSIAILTSERAEMSDVRVRELADEILVAQRREIDEMEWLIGDIDENGPATTEEEAEARPVPEFDASP